LFAKKVLQSFLQIVRNWFDMDKKLLHNLVSLLLAHNQNQAAGLVGKLLGNTEYSGTLFFKNLTTDKCGRLE